MNETRGSFHSFSKAFKLNFVNEICFFLSLYHFHILLSLKLTHQCVLYQNMIFLKVEESKKKLKTLWLLELCF